MTEVLSPMFVPMTSLVASYVNFAAGDRKEPQKVPLPSGFRAQWRDQIGSLSITLAGAEQRDFQSSLAGGVAEPNCEFMIELPSTPPQTTRKANKKELLKTPVPVNKQCIDDVDVNVGREETFKPGIDETAARQVAAILASQTSKNNTRWWTSTKQALICPLSNFPICLLPYPPFKLHMPPGKVGSRKLVDGKFLSLMVISTGQMQANGREFDSADIEALDEYMHRCKLGSFRPGRALALASDAKSATLSEESKQNSVAELMNLRALARAEFGKLRQIQKSRFLQCQEMVLGLSSMKPKGDAGFHASPGNHLLTATMET